MKFSVKPFIKGLRFPKAAHLGALRRARNLLSRRALRKGLNLQNDPAECFAKRGNPAREGSPLLVSYERFPSSEQEGKKKARPKPDFLYKRQSPVPTLAFGRRCGNNDKNNGTWMHDRGVTMMRDLNPVLPSHYHVLRSHSHPQRSRPHPMATTLPSSGPAAVGRAARNAMRVSTTQTEGGPPNAEERELYSSRSEVQLVACRVLSKRRSSREASSACRCRAGTSTAERILISVRVAQWVFWLASSTRRR